MKVLLRRFLHDQDFALGVLAAFGLAAAEALIGDGLQTSDLPTIAAIFTAAAARRRRRAA